jgi:(E)-4-hydroxy-3-methylbut-2-enyl-diphosphate synthase
VDGVKTVTLKGENIAQEFQKIVEQYVAKKYPTRTLGEPKRHPVEHPAHS